MNILFNSHPGFFTQKNKVYTGTQHFTDSFIQHLKNTKHSFTGLVFERKKQIENQFKYRVVKHEKNSWIVVNSWVKSANIINNKPQARFVIENLKAAISKAKPDLFFLNGFSALASLILTAAHELDIPIVTTHHGIWYKEYSVLHQVLRREYKARIALERKITQFSAKEIFISKLSLREYEKHICKVPQTKRLIIPIPYKPVFANTKIPLPNSKQPLKILLVGRWDGVKNHEAYLKLAKEAKRQKLNWQFYSVTDITDWPHYKHIANDYKKNIAVFPSMLPKQLKKIYQKINIVVVPSYFETFSGVVMESLMQNRPALISKNVGWVDDYKTLGLSRWIVDFNNPKIIIAKIKVETKRSVPIKIIKQITKNNHPTRIFNKYVKVFESIAK